jgi:hypothetical protein
MNKYAFQTKSIVQCIGKGLVKVFDPPSYIFLQVPKFLCPIRYPSQSGCYNDEINVNTQTALRKSS